jgi:hypothetical protein
MVNCFEPYSQMCECYEILLFFVEVRFNLVHINVLVFKDRGGVRWARDTALEPLSKYLSLKNELLFRFFTETDHKASRSKSCFALQR